MGGLFCYGRHAKHNSRNGSQVISSSCGLLRANSLRQYFDIIHYLRDIFAARPGFVNASEVRPPSQLRLEVLSFTTQNCSVE